MKLLFLNLLFLSNILCVQASTGDTIRNNFKTAIYHTEIITKLINTFENKDFSYCQSILDSTVTVIVFDGTNTYQGLINGNTKAETLNKILTKIPYFNIQINNGSNEENVGYIVTLISKENIRFTIYLVINKVNIITTIIFK